MRKDRLLKSMISAENTEGGKECALSYQKYENRDEKRNPGGGQKQAAKNVEYFQPLLGEMK